MWEGDLAKMKSLNGYNLFHHKVKDDPECRQMITYLGLKDALLFSVRFGSFNVPTDVMLAASTSRRFIT